MMADVTAVNSPAQWMVIVWKIVLFTKRKFVLMVPPNHMLAVRNRSSRQGGGTIIRHLKRGQNATPFPALTIQPPLQDMFGVWKMPEKSLAWDGQEWNVLLVTGAEDVNATSASKKSSQFYSQILSILSINVLNFLTIVHINVNIS